MLIHHKIDKEGNGETAFTIPKDWEKRQKTKVERFYLKEKESGVEFPRAYYVANPNTKEKDEALTLINKDAPVCPIEAKVKEGFAVAEVKLQHCKTYEDNKDWLNLLKNGFADTKEKTAEFYIKVEASKLVPHDKKEFLNEVPFIMIGNNWHEPVDDPQIAVYNQHGKEKAKSSTFGTGRGYTHSGLDIFALEGSNVYACLDAEVFETKEWIRKSGKSGYVKNRVILPIENYEIRFYSNNKIVALWQKNLNPMLYIKGEYSNSEGGLSKFE